MNKNLYKNKYFLKTQKVNQSAPLPPPPTLPFLPPTNFPDLDKFLNLAFESTFNFERFYLRTVYTSPVFTVLFPEEGT